jgi:hypothetical protein
LRRGVAVAQLAAVTGTAVLAAIEREYGIDRGPETETAAATVGTAIDPVFSLYRGQYCGPGHGGQLSDCDSDGLVSLTRTPTFSQPLTLALAPSCS